MFDMAKEIWVVTLILDSNFNIIAHWHLRLDIHIEIKTPLRKTNADQESTRGKNPRII